MCDKLYLKQGYCNPRIDSCIQELVFNINKKPNLKTLASCCGHNRYPKTIVVKNKTTHEIFEYFSKIPLGKRKRNRYYKKDKSNYYFIPELIEVSIKNVEN